MKDGARRSDSATDPVFICATFYFKVPENTWTCGGEQRRWEDPLCMVTEADFGLAREQTGSKSWFCEVNDEGGLLVGSRFFC